MRPITKASLRDAGNRSNAASGAASGSAAISKLRAASSRKLRQSLFGEAMDRGRDRRIVERPGPCDRVPSAGRAAARYWGGCRRRHLWRFDPRSPWIRRGGLAQRHAGRRRHRERNRRNAAKGATRRGAAAPGRRGGAQLPRWDVRDRRHRTEHQAVRGRRARERARAPGRYRGGLDTRGEVKTAPSFPNGCHVAEVEIDPATGLVDIVSYVAVDDCGRVLDSVIVAGDIHGGVAQGLGQAVCEAVVYDPENGQALTGSLMDYAVPRAADVPAMSVHHHEALCTTNPLGVERNGEAGTTAAPCAIVNAIVNALPPELGRQSRCRSRRRRCGAPSIAIVRACANQR